MKDNVYLYLAVTHMGFIVYLTQVCWLGVESQDLFYTHFPFVSMLQSWETPSSVVLYNHGRKGRLDWAAV